jgi:hypothetical protein
MQSGVVTDSVNSIHFLWYAYVLIAAAQIGFVAWLATSWSKLNKPKR